MTLGDYQTPLILEVIITYLVLVRRQKLEGCDDGPVSAGYVPYAPIVNGESFYDRHLHVSLELFNAAKLCDKRVEVSVEYQRNWTKKRKDQF